MPIEIQNLKWNWGAFNLPGFWLMAHNRVIAGSIVILIWIIEAVLHYVSPPLALLVFVGLLPYRAVLAAQGNKTAWRSRRFYSIDHFFAVQRAWLFWSIASCVIVIILSVIAVAAIVSAHTSPQ